MRYVENALENTRIDETVCMSIAATLHILLLIWNPIVLKSDWHPPHDFVTVDVVEQPAAGAPIPEEKPAKMSLMDTLKDMLLKPKTEEMAHIAPEPVQPAASPAPVAPVLKEAGHTHPILSNFIPKNQTEDIAGANAPNRIQTDTKNIAPMPLGGPTLKAKAFGGIKTQDLPFQVSRGNEGLSTGGPSAIPIAVGNGSAKNALGYTSPSLQESNKHTLGGFRPMSSRTDAGASATLGGSPVAAPIALSGSANVAPSAGNAAPSLQNREGGTSRVGAALLGMNRGTYNTMPSIESMPSAAKTLDSQLAQSAATTQTSRRPSKGYDISGPLNNRPILYKTIPQYPSWAEEQGIIGSVRLYFTVTAEGTVRPNITVTKTTGYPQLDQLGIDALKQWKFAPLGSSEDASGEWGIITFTFSLAS